MSPTSPASRIVPLLQTAVAAPPVAASSTAHGEPAARSSSPPLGGTSRRHALLKQLPPSEAEKLKPLARMLNVDIPHLDALLLAVAWVKDEQTGTYAVRGHDGGQAHALYIGEFGPVMEFPARMIEESTDTSPEAAAARQVHKLMTEVAAPRVQALVFSSVQPVVIGKEMFHLQVRSPDAHRAHAVLDDGQPLHLVWQEQHGHYVPAADVVAWPVSPGPEPAPAPAGPPVVLLSSAQTPGTDSATAMGIKEESDDESAPVWKGAGKRAAPDSLPQGEGSRAKRVRQESGLPADEGAEARWDAYRNSLEIGLPDFMQLAEEGRRLLQAAAICVPNRMEFEQRDWQARKAGQPLSAQAIIEAHRQARFTRLAERIAGVSSYRSIKLGDDAQRALDFLSDENKTAAALYEKLQPVKTDSRNANRKKLRYFDAYRGQKELASILPNFFTFVTDAHMYKETLSQSQTGEAQNRAVNSLRHLCYPELPFQKHIAALIGQTGSKFHVLKDKAQLEYRTAASKFEAWLARNGHAPNTIPSDVEGLWAFLILRQAVCAQNKGDKSLKGVLNLWREEVHPLYLDDRLDAAIDAHSGEPSTKEMCKREARRLAEYAWCHQMPKAEYTRWLRTVDLNGMQFKAVCEWSQINENHLRSIIYQFRRHRPAPVAIPPSPSTQLRDLSACVRSSHHQ